MKALLFAAGIISFVLYQSEKLGSNLRGTRNVPNKFNGEMLDKSKPFSQISSVGLYSNAIKTKEKPSGLRTDAENNEPAIFPEERGGATNSFFLNGTIVPQKTGEWQLGNNSSNHFFDLKAPFTSRLQP